MTSEEEGGLQQSNNKHHELHLNITKKIYSDCLPFLLVFKL